MKPVFVVTQSRAGSSLTVSIFIAHGLNVGKETNKAGWGYRTFESGPVREFHQANTTPKTGEPRGNDLKQKAIGVVSQIPGRPVIKIHAKFYPIWLDAFEDANFVYLIRDPKDVATSLWKKGRTHLDRWKMLPHAEMWNDRIIRFAGERGGPVIYISRVMEGDRSSLYEALEYCEIEPDDKLIDGCIQPEKWHEKGRGCALSA